MSTAISDREDKKEYFDSPEDLAEKLDVLAEWFQEAQHAIAFTGAGISTACGVPDFRSGMGTVLETGPGAWELRAHKQSRSRRCSTTSTLKAIPSFTHMTFVELQRRGLLQYLVSQNTDGLHRRSGFPADKLSELHGNSNLEVCPRCQHQFLRDTKVRRRGNKVHQHATGRICTVPGCSGKLRDSIINFGENLPEKPLELAFEHADRADLCLAMGSSLRVTPAADVPEQVATRNQRLVIVNLQRTPLDDDASMVIHARCDDVMRGLAERLQITPPPFRLTRFVRVGVKRTPRRGTQAQVRGEDADGTPFSFVTRCELQLGRRGESLQMTSGKLRLPTDLADGTILRFTLHFAGHYGEPPLTVTHRYNANTDDSDLQRMRISYNPANGQWSIGEARDARLSIASVGSDDGDAGLIEQLAALGFSSEDAAGALQSAGGDVDIATAQLLSTAS